MKASPPAVAVALLLSGGACASSRAQAPRAPFGLRPQICYALEYPDEPAPVFPARIGIIPPRGWTVAIPSRAGRRYRQMLRGGGVATPSRGDSIAIQFSNGFSTVVLHLKADGDRLTGEAWFASDVVPATPPPRTRVAGRRIACDPHERW
jgi:hypothetical protein